ncbi:T9SS type A sorting domain-containing protein [Crocinitomix catalasitica]|uniref:T9SS type A sorting domain-containing protein n=1 Tax=Crocinitomix catalasitica TaxID=184607 RepID=UPI000688FEE6|nr:T9SS type A sorting domain-containing protein [Crocinitomix catalasitica]
MKKKLFKSAFLIAGLVFANFNANAQEVTYDYTGTIQTYIVPDGVTSIQISSTGAKGGNNTTVADAANPGKGAQMVGTFSVTPGETLNILVGEEGATAQFVGGGGGGSFVWKTADDILLIAAGGGGGTGYTDIGGLAFSGIDASIMESGTNGNEMPDGGGVSGNGGTTPTTDTYASGGAGWLTSGSDGTTHGCANLSTGGQTPLDGGAGGTGGGGDDYAAPGGFGGGGGGNGRCGAVGGGGGGGYSGGGAGGEPLGGGFNGGGGGGSYNSGISQSNSAGIGVGNGQVIITVVCTPLTVTATETTICLGTSFTLDASGSGTITWDNGVINGEPFTPTEIGLVTYTATSDDDADCNYSINIEVVDAPTISYVLTHEIAGYDAAIDLTVEDGTPTYTYDWDNDGTGDFDDMQDLTGLTSGTYNVVVKDQNECSATSSIEINRFASVTNNDELNLSVYPNPTSDQLTIETEGNFSYQIIGINGAVLINGTATNKTDVSLIELANGFYFVKVNTAYQEQVLEIVKK